jgi:TP901 family phage tail tape measure protein
MKTVVDLITTAIRAFDLKATETSRVADIFANAVNRSKLTIDKLRIAFNYIGPIAAKTGITLEETAATTMMLANAGIRASTIGTGLRRTFQQLIEPTKELQAAIEAAGYTTEDFNPQMNDMRDIIRRLTEIVPDAESAFRMFSLRSSAAVAALSSQGVASFDALHSAVLRSGTAAEMAEKQIEGLGIIFKQAMDKAHDLALAFGEAGVSGALRFVGKRLQNLFDLLRFFVESGVVEAIVKVGVLTIAFYSIAKAWAAIQVAQWAITLKLFVTQLGLAGAAAEGFGVALASLQKGIMPLLILSAALYGAYKLFTVLLSTEVKKVNTKYIDSKHKIY